MGSTGNSTYGDVLLGGLQDKNIQSRIAAIKADIFICGVINGIC